MHSQRDAWIDGEQAGEWSGGQCERIEIHKCIGR